VRLDGGQPHLQTAFDAGHLDGRLKACAGRPLGSWWGALIMVAIIPALVWRLLDEEKFLARNLPGYVEYQNKVRYRLIPGVW
jgi:protein-S-isoprenylcysteine O-methyltransferase Ste14